MKKIPIFFSSQFFFSKAEEEKFLNENPWFLTGTYNPVKTPCSPSSTKKWLSHAETVKEDASWIRLLNIYYERDTYLLTLLQLGSLVQLMGWEKRKSDKICGTCSCSLSASVLLLKLLEVHLVIVYQPLYIILKAFWNFPSFNHLFGLLDHNWIALARSHFR